MLPDICQLDGVLKMDFLVALMDNVFLPPIIVLCKIKLFFVNERQKGIIGEYY